MINDYYVLNEDIFSHSRTKNILGKQGDKVQWVFTVGGCAVVRNTVNGQTFPCNEKRMIRIGAKQKV